MKYFVLKSAISDKSGIKTLRVFFFVLFFLCASNQIVIASCKYFECCFLIRAVSDGEKSFIFFHFSKYMNNTFYLFFFSLSLKFSLQQYANKDLDLTLQRTKKEEKKKERKKEKETDG